MSVRKRAIYSGSREFQGGWVLGHEGLLTFIEDPVEIGEDLQY